MSKQLTLFGKRAVPASYFTNPKSDYERFVNKKWSESSERFGRKQNFLQFVLVEWEKIKNDKERLVKYLENEQHSPSKKVHRPSFFQPPTVTSMSRPINPLLSKPAIVSRKQNTTPLPRMNIAETLNVPTSPRESYLLSQEFQMIKAFLSDIAFKRLDDFFTDDIVSDDSLVKTLASISFDWKTFSSLRKSYLNQSKYKRNSNIKSNLREIDIKCSELAMIFGEVCKLRTNPTMRAALISETYLKKAEKIKELICTIGIIQTKITNKDLLSNLRRRLKQQSNNSTSRKSGELHKCICYNNSKLSWEDTFDVFLDHENSNLALHGPLTTTQLTEIGQIISENIVTTVSEIEIVMNDDCLHQILRHMPVMFLKTEKSGVFLNLQEFVYTPGAIEALLECSSPASGDDDLDKMPPKESDIAPTENPNEDKLVQNPSSKSCGQPSLVSRFPDLVDAASEFVKQHGFSAQCRRRTETGYSSGVTVAEIRQHLLKEIPGLREHGISLTTIRRLFQAPNKGNRASKRYRCLVDARVATKSNRYREFHPDSHYLFSRNKHRREFCTLFKSEACIVSMDDMAKIKVGAPAVSRYHQLRRLCPTMDMPNYADHDFPVPNYLLSASGE